MPVYDFQVTEARYGMAWSESPALPISRVNPISLVSKTSIRAQFTIHQHAINLFNSNGAHSNYTYKSCTLCVCVCWFVFYYIRFVTFVLLLLLVVAKMKCNFCGARVRFVVLVEYRSINSNQPEIAANTPIYEVDLVCCMA